MLLLFLCCRTQVWFKRPLIISGRRIISVRGFVSHRQHLFM
nr:MAG TPA: hypothetical protein [Caudoviricetes sp.]